MKKRDDAAAKIAEKPETFCDRSAEETLRALGTGAGGLTEKEAAARAEKYGANAFEKQKKRSLAVMALAQLKDVSVIILIIAGALSLALAIANGEGAGGLLEPLIIFAIVAMDIVLAVVQERSAENALEALGSLSAPVCRVMREGRPTEVHPSALVPGDVIVLRTGDLVPADARLLTANSLSVDESALTGESMPAEKDADVVLAGSVPLGDRANMLHSGCLVTAGSGTAVVTATGMNSEMGRIARCLTDAGARKTTLQKRLDKVGSVISGIAIVSAVVLLAVGLARGRGAMEMLVAAMTLAVAAVPETLSLIVTLILSRGAKKMAARGALVRQMQAVETLGSTSVICSDKTGTLTMNRMTVRRIWTVDEETTGESERAFLEKLCLACSATRGKDAEGNAVTIGDPTERAIVSRAEELGIDYAALKSSRAPVAEIPFSSARKMMTTVYRRPEGGYLVLTKGALDRIPLAPASADDARAKQAHDSFASDALRVIALAEKVTDELPDDVAEVEKDLTLCGIAGIIDPPRPEAKEAIAKAKAAGIRTVMITGDHAATAAAIARDLGITAAGEGVITGSELAALSDEQLESSVEFYSVYARVSPEDKIRIVRAWQARGETVAMTGDGVNDAPALKNADVGIAMGKNGTDVAKSAAKVVLTDDRFATIVDAVAEGRNIFSNIRKLVYFLLVCNISEIAVMLVAQFAGLELPLTPVMLLLINVLGDGVPGLMLAREESDKRIMKRRPIAANESFFGGGMTEVIIKQICAFSAVSLAAYCIGLYADVGASGLAAGRTMAFLVTGWTSVLHVLTVRSRSMLYRYRIKDNPGLYISCFSMLAAIALLALVPPLASALGMCALSPLQWLIAAGLSLVPLLVAEYGKFWDAVRTRTAEKTRV